jgi:hypothetical protein
MKFVEKGERTRKRKITKRCEGGKQISQNNRRILNCVVSILLYSKKPKTQRFIDDYVVV